MNVSSKVETIWYRKSREAFDSEYCMLGDGGRKIFSDFQVCAPLVTRQENSALGGAPARKCKIGMSWIWETTTGTISQMPQQNMGMC